MDTNGALPVHQSVVPMKTDIQSLACFLCFSVGTLLSFFNVFCASKKLTPSDRCFWSGHGFKTEQEKEETIEDTKQNCPFDVNHHVLLRLSGDDRKVGRIKKTHVTLHYITLF